MVKSPSFDVPLVRRSLLVTDQEIAKQKEQIKTDSQLAQVAAALQKSADRLLNDPPLVRKLVGPRLLAVSRDAQRRIWLLAGMHRWTGDRKYANRAIVELRAVCNFTDWNPSHFLDVAEMCAAVSVGYDWLYDELSKEDRELIRGAIVSKALLPAIEAFDKKIWWTTTDSNWAQVCSGGLAMGALAVRTEEPQIARKILTLTERCMEPPMHVYAPDGGYREGAGYWNYGTRYSVFYFAALQSVLAYDSPLIKSEGFDQTGFFRIHTIGPSGKLFNYADCNETVDSSSVMFWLARQFHQPIFAMHEREFALAKPDILHLFWWNPENANLAETPTAVHFRTAGAICMRSGWDKDAMYVGLKAGSNDFSHAHLDLGSFVLDCDGERWAIDLGPDDYDLPGYFFLQRWNYYRLRTEGHNTVCFDGNNQSPNGFAVVQRFDPAQHRLDLDLSPARAWNADSVERHVYMKDRVLLMRDRAFAGEKQVPRWQMHTRAKVTLSEDHQSATLRQNGKSLHVQLGTPGLAFEVNDVTLAPPCKPTTGVKRLTINLAATREVLLWFSPGVLDPSQRPHFPPD